MNFFRFPHTPHLAWLGKDHPRDDKVLSPLEVEALLAGEVVVEEKVDGANVGFSVAEDGVLRVQNRGSYLDRTHASPQFRPLWPWVDARQAVLVDAVRPDGVLFGEWCYAVHSVEYTELPDWFLGFDVCDNAAGRFWDTSRRDQLLRTARLRSVPLIARGRFGIKELEQFLSSTSAVGQGPIEGLVIRQESGGFTTARAKLVRPEFAQAIDEHWSRRPLRRNELAKGTTSWA